MCGGRIGVNVKSWEEKKVQAMFHYTFSVTVYAPASAQIQADAGGYTHQSSHYHLCRLSLSKRASHQRELGRSCLAA